MNSYLDKIIASKRAEIAGMEQSFREKDFTSEKFFKRKCISLKDRLILPDSSGIIAEFKRKSPSKGAINLTAKVADVTRGYSAAGAAGLSVLTDHPFFGGSLPDLVAARLANPETPILRKDFVIDPLQVAEAKAFGADVILLIAACLNREMIHSLAQYAHALGMETLLEIHDETELDKISRHIDLVGVNNRNLKTFEVSTEASLRLGPLIPGKFVKISESGITSPETIVQLREAGFSGFLMGETFMKTADPAKACREFITNLHGVTGGQGRGQRSRLSAVRRESMVVKGCSRTSPSAFEILK